MQVCAETQTRALKIGVLVKPSLGSPEKVQNVLLDLLSPGSWMVSTARKCRGSLLLCSSYPLVVEDGRIYLQKVKRGLGKADQGLTCGKRSLSHSQGDKMALRAVGDSSPMAELSCFRNFWLCNACRLPSLVE
ncbi:hypothetical protein Taro_002484 [Colocasia esculenta]|uniref:Uncharacterized protein n=1 Tax=Colocasia esculenta TaxID=4460 RepID=A0A843THA8_COLES|nr:hypothetical protein [Colocasia esculenta]